MSTDLGDLLLVSSRWHACLEVALWALNIALSQSEHVLDLNILQVLFNDLRLLLMMAGSQARVQELLRVLTLGSRSILSRQVEHGSWADTLSRAQLLYSTVLRHLLLLHLLHSLQVFLLLLQIVLLAWRGRLAWLMVMMLVFWVTSMTMNTLARCTLYACWLPCWSLLLVAVLAASSLLTWRVVLKDWLRCWIMTVVSLLRAMLRRVTPVQDQVVEVTCATNAVHFLVLVCRWTWSAHDIRNQKRVDTWAVVASASAVVRLSWVTSLSAIASLLISPQVAVALSIRAVLMCGWIIAFTMVVVTWWRNLVVILIIALSSHMMMPLRAVLNWRGPLGLASATDNSTCCYTLMSLKTALGNLACVSTVLSTRIRSADVACVCCACARSVVLRGLRGCATGLLTSSCHSSWLNHIYLTSKRLTLLGLPNLLSGSRCLALVLCGECKVLLGLTLCSRWMWLSVVACSSCLIRSLDIWLRGLRLLRGTLTGINLLEVLACCPRHIDVRWVALWFLNQLNYLLRVVQLRVVAEWFTDDKLLLFNVNRVPLVCCTAGVWGGWLSICVTLKVINELNFVCRKDLVGLPLLGLLAVYVRFLYHCSLLMGALNNFTLLLALVSWFDWGGLLRFILGFFTNLLMNNSLRLVCRLSVFSWRWSYLLLLLISTSLWWISIVGILNNNLVLLLIRATGRFASLLAFQGSDFVLELQNLILMVLVSLLNIILVLLHALFQSALILQVTSLLGQFLDIWKNDLHVYVVFISPFPLVDLFWD